ncbi:MAG: hypothetical protein HY581_02200 [Nitrospirae bacterium]|nr:hypothetical protein [Nitrospirota bacterium]
MAERQVLSTKLSILATSVDEFDCLVAETLPDLLDRATDHLRRFLRETGQWADDISHEKLALRWGYELLERFLVWGRNEVPCRPYFLLDSFIARYLSQPEPFCYHKDLLTPLGRFLDGVTARAVLSRDALMALFYHLYGFGQGQVVRILDLGPTESQRVYKNFERWRRAGWQRAMIESGMTDSELLQIEDQKRRHSEQIIAEADRLLRAVQDHYRKSEPDHFRCLTRQQWAHMFQEGYGYDYRVWHLALCRECLVVTYDLRQDGLAGIPAPRIDLQFRPLSKGRIVSFIMKYREDGNGAGRPTQRLSRTSA